MAEEDETMICNPRDGYMDRSTWLMATTQSGRQENRQTGTAIPFLVPWIDKFENRQRCEIASSINLRRNLTQDLIPTMCSTDGMIAS